MAISGELLTNFTGSAAVTLSFIVAIPQIIKMVRTKSVGDISRASLFLILLVDLLYLTRALYLRDMVFICGKVWAVTVILIQLAMVFYYRDQRKRHMDAQ